MADSRVTGGGEGLAHLRNLFSRGRRSSGSSVPEAAGVAVLEAAPDEPVELPQSTLATRWPPRRISVAESLWGEGFVTPGGGAEVLRLALPLGLSEKASLLLIGIGTGGAPRLLADELGVWISAYGSDPSLVALAAHRIQRAGAAVAKHVTVDAWDRAEPRFRAHAFHHAVALDALRNAAASRVLAALQEAIKPGGQLVLQELVAEAPLDPHDQAVEAWCRLDQRSPDLPSEAAVTSELQRLHFDVRVLEDQSDRHIGLIVQGWQRLVESIEVARPSRGHAGALVDEAELWARRIGLLQAGRIRLLRWHAFAAAAQ